MHGRKLKEVLLDSKLTHEQTALTSYTFLKDSEVSGIIDRAGISKLSNFTGIHIYHDINQKEIIDHPFEINYINGRTNDDKGSFIKSNLVICAPSSKFNNNAPSQGSIIKHFVIPNTPGNRILNKAKKKRHLLCDSTTKKW